MSHVSTTSNETGTQGSPSLIKRLILPVTMFVTFWCVSIVFWQSTGYIFFLFNFGYIGTSIGVGMGLYALLPRRKKPIGRKLAQFLVGGYLLILLGFVGFENLQIEGFFFYLLSGYFAGAVVHYTIAKIIGPMLFNRAWCSWSCWTAMILDLLPFNRSTGWVRGRLPWLRYGLFGLSLGTVLGFWFLAAYHLDTAYRSFLWLLVGNLLYYAVAIGLAYYYRDNRAFCKYVCPVTVLMKVTSRFSLMKIAGEKSACTDCRACTRTCPMDIDIPSYIIEGKRVLTTECIMCETCVTVCPQQTLRISFGLDLGGEDMLVYRDGETRRVPPATSRPRFSKHCANRPAHSRTHDQTLELPEDHPFRTFSS